MENLELWYLYSGILANIAILLAIFMHFLLKGW